jgi:hypothetical protein
VAEIRWTHSQSLGAIRVRFTALEEHLGEADRLVGRGLARHDARTLGDGDHGVFRQQRP